MFLQTTKLYIFAQKSSAYDNQCPDTIKFLLQYKIRDVVPIS